MKVKFCYTPEPVLLFYYLSVMLQYPVVQQYVYSYYSEQYGLQYEYDQASTTCGNVYNATQETKRKNVQLKVSKFNVEMILAQSVAAVFTIPLLGSISDITGRRKMLLISSGLAAINSLILLAVISFKLNIHVAYIGSLMGGLGGSFTGFTTIVFAFITDVTDSEKLPARLALVEAIVLLGMATTNFNSGILVKNTSFKTSQLLSCLAMVVVFLWVALFLNESLNCKGKKTRLLTCSDIISLPKSLWRIFSKPRQNRWKVYTSLVILLSGYALSVGVFSIVTLYLLNTPFCFPATQIGYYLGSALLTMSLGTVLGVKFGLKCFSGPFLVVFANVNGAIYYILLGCSTNVTWVYAALAAKVFSQMQLPIFRSILSRSVESNEIGSIFSIVSGMDQFCLVVTNFLFNFFYTEFNNHGHANNFFFIPAALFVIPIAVTIFFWYRTTKPNDGEREQLINSVH